MSDDDEVYGCLIHGRVEGVIPTDGPQKWVKKPVVIEAMRLTDENGGKVVQWVNDHFADEGVANLRGGPGGGSRNASVLLSTVEGVVQASPGDWVVRGVQHEFYPCKPDIFAATYERVLSETDGLAEADEDRDREAVEQEHKTEPSFERGDRVEGPETGTGTVVEPTNGAGNVGVFWDMRRLNTVEWPQARLLKLAGGASSRQEQREAATTQCGARRGADLVCKLPKGHRGRRHDAGDITWVEGAATDEVSGGPFSIARTLRKGGHSGAERLSTRTRQLADMEGERDRLRERVEKVEDALRQSHDAVVALWRSTNGEVDLREAQERGARAQTRTVDVLGPYLSVPWRDWTPGAERFPARPSQQQQITEEMFERGIEATRSIFAALPPRREQIVKAVLRAVLNPKGDNDDSWYSESPTEGALSASRRARGRDRAAGAGRQ